jgi:hypothetical protein
LRVSKRYSGDERLSKDETVRSLQPLGSHVERLQREVTLVTAQFKRAWYIDKRI